MTRSLGLHLGLILLCASLFGVSGPLDTPETEALSMDEYWQQIESSLSLITGWREAEVEDAHHRLEELALQWEKIDAVLLPDGAIILLDHSFLVQQMRQEPADLARLQGLLAHLIQTAHTWPAEKASPTALTLLASILQQPEFDWPTPEPSPLQLLRERIGRLLHEFLLNLLPEGISLNFGGSFLNWLLIGISLLILTLILFFVLRGLLTGMVKDAALHADAAIHQEAITAEEARQKAQLSAQTGDYRAAVRFLYLSALLSIAERGIIRFDPSQTNHEMLHSIRHQPDLARPMRDVVDIFDRVWYGYQPIDAEHYAHYAARVDELRRVRA